MGEYREEARIAFPDPTEHRLTISAYVARYPGQPDPGEVTSSGDAFV